MPGISWYDSNRADSKAIAACARKAPTSQTCYLFFFLPPPVGISPLSLDPRTCVVTALLLTLFVACVSLSSNIKTILLIRRFLFQSCFFTTANKQSEAHKIFVKPLGFMLFAPFTRDILQLYVFQMLER